MQFRQAILTVNGKAQQLQPDRSNSFEALYVDFRQEEINGGRQWSVFLHPKEDILLQGLEIQFDLSLPAGSQFFANGYQSRSESRLLDLDASIPALRGLAGKKLKYSGDDHIGGIPRGRGRLHSWTYTYIKKPASTIMAGSLSEQTGFTLFLYDQASGILTVRKDLDNLKLPHSFPALDFWIAESTEKDVFDAWFLTMNQPKALALPGLGWTSKGHSSAETILQNLENISATDLPFRHFLLADGWQTATGDWFSPKPGFSRGLSGIASAIREKRLVPGLWLAPFVAAENAEIVRKNPEWLLKDAAGKPVQAGWNPDWGGWYYALDFYNNGVRDYLSGVFHTVLDKWGFEQLTLDYLSAVCLYPPAGKTRGAVMWEAMEFLRNLAGKRNILAAGAPLGACLGQVDYYSVNGGKGLVWEARMDAWLRHRERADSISALHSTLGRWQLNGRAFVSEAGVFSLQGAKQKHSPAQQHSILTIYTLLGGVLFTADNVADYSPELLSELQSVLDLHGSEVREVRSVQPDVFRIDFTNAGARFFALCNLTPRKIASENGLELSPFETIVLSAPR